MANKYESTSGLGVKNHYGPREVGGTAGVAGTSGVENEFLVDYDNANIDASFPVTDGKAYVIEVDQSLLGGSVTDIKIGGVDVDTATPEAPVQIPAGNTGAIVATGGDGTGKLLVKFKKYPL